VPNESWLLPGLLGCFGPPLGLFLFAYTASTTPSIHWLVPTTGIAIFSAGSFAVFQSLICYIALSYPKYVASLFAANDFARGLAAAGMVAGSRYMYEALGVEKGVVLVGGLSCLGIVGVWALWWCGEGLRRRSRFTGE
jgi:MFS transporter, DHA1 family, multidrug resistance protein